ncbi:unnamed protein product [Meloidogyne enterolobii]|uniref:Uncharacterized protein n=1 Tax=Meloidogyne enterolobii TaxID=390850 RepID=A0ACB0ZG62_MELEN
MKLSICFVFSGIKVRIYIVSGKLYYSLNSLDFYAPINKKFLNLSIETYNNLWKGIDSHISTLIVLFESNTNSLVGAQLLLDLSGYADKVVARRCVNNALANALQIKDFPTFAVFRRGERSPAYIAERLLLNEFEQLLRNDSKETSKRSMNKFFSRKKFASGSENIEQFCSNFPQICKRAYFVSELDLLKSARIGKLF